MSVPAARFGVLVLPLALLSLRPGSPLTEPVPAKPISEVALTAFRLHQIEDSGWTDEEGWTGIVTPAARPLLAIFTRQLRELIGRELNGEAGSGTADEIQAKLVGALEREGVPMGGDDTNHPYGKVLELEVRRPAGLDRWLAVVVARQITCGFNKALYVFERQEGRWRLALALEANPDEEIYEGMALLDFGISPPDRRGGSFIVVADVHPQCVSNWRRLRYRVFRLDGDPLNPQPFFAGEGSVFQCDFELSMGTDRFLVRFQGMQNLDYGFLIRSIVRAYRITGTKAERIGPLADDERGFLAEWLSLPWEIAGRWAAIPGWDSLRLWHYKLQGMLADEKLSFTDFGPLGTCGNSRSLVVLNLEWKAPTESDPREIFFTIRGQGDDFEMERIGVTEPEGCVASP
jgi:hypothetical protein